MVGGRVKLLPAEANKWGSDSNSGRFTFRRTTTSHRNWTHINGLVLNITGKLVIYGIHYVMIS